MAAMSDSIEGLILNYIFRSQAFTQPTVLAHCLMTTAAVDADTGVFTSGTGVEVTNANGYLRQNEAAGTGNWTDATAGDGQTDNVNEIAFPQATGDYPANVVAMAITDNVTHDAGAMYFHGTLDVAKDVNSGDTFKFAVGAVNVNFA